MFTDVRSFATMIPSPRVPVPVSVYTPISSSRQPLARPRPRGLLRTPCLRPYSREIRSLTVKVPTY